MANTAAGIEPVVLKWAREQAGYDVNEVAHALGKDASVVLAWEAGEDAPTYTQLEKLAYTIYKRPLAIFFLPEPPKEANIKQEFRTLPDFEMDRLAPDTRCKIRMAHAFQLSLAELNNGANPSERKIFRDISLSLNANIAHYAQRIRDYLGVSLESQIDCRDADASLKVWRTVIEQAGIFVFKDSFKQKDISGFCLFSDEFPIIYINNSTTKTRQTFTLIHELVHLLLQVNAIAKVDDSYIDFLPQKEQNIERFCNALAAEVLIPSEDFAIALRKFSDVNIANISHLADRYCVSREAILRCLLERKLVGREYYQEKVKQWNQEMKVRGPGGDANRTKYVYLSEHYLNIVFAKHYQGAISVEQVADYLGVKTKRVSVLEDIMLSKAAR